MKPERVYRTMKYGEGKVSVDDVEKFMKQL